MVILYPIMAVLFSVVAQAQGTQDICTPGPSAQPLSQTVTQTLQSITVASRQQTPPAEFSSDPSIQLKTCMWATEVGGHATGCLAQTFNGKRIEIAEYAFRLRSKQFIVRTPGEPDQIITLDDSSLDFMDNGAKLILVDDHTFAVVNNYSILFFSMDSNALKPNESSDQPVLKLTRESLLSRFQVADNADHTLDLSGEYLSKFFELDSKGFYMIDHTPAISRKLRIDPRLNLTYLKSVHARALLLPEAKLEKDQRLYRCVPSTTPRRGFSKKEVNRQNTCAQSVLKEYDDAISLIEIGKDQTFTHPYRDMPQAKILEKIGTENPTYDLAVIARFSDRNRDRLFFYVPVVMVRNNGLGSGVRIDLNWKNPYLYFGK